MSTPIPSPEEVFHQARKMASQSERTGYLRGACGDDLALRSKVEALLKADAEASGFGVGSLAVLIGLACAVSFAPLACTNGVESERAAESRTSRLQWGLYQILWSHDYEQRMARELSHFASTPDYVMFYRDLGRPFTQSAIDAVHANGATPIVSLELGLWHHPEEAYLPRIVAGDLDDDFREWARGAKTDGRRLLLRFGFEANGDWFSWGGDPQAYVAAWRHAYGLFEEQGADNVEWVWAPNCMSVPDTPDNDLHLYYPGDAFVDWVGIDGYNWGAEYDEWHHWESFEEIFGATVTDFEHRYPGKRIMIAETGCAPGEPGRKADWIRQAWQAATAMPIEAVVWFNYDKRRGGELDWRIASSPESLAAFNEAFAAAPGG